MGDTSCAGAEKKYKGIFVPTEPYFRTPETTLRMASPQKRVAKTLRN
jgi:hypothetical protein